jgi:hypothetical protein
VIKAGAAAPEPGKAAVTSCRGGRTGAAAGDATTFPFRGAAPDAVIDVVFHRIFKARRLHRAALADLSRYVHADAVAREEGLWCEVSAASRSHPLRFHHSTVLTPALTKSSPGSTCRSVYRPCVYLCPESPVSSSCVILTSESVRLPRVAEEIPMGRFLPADKRPQPGRAGAADGLWTTCSSWRPPVPIPGLMKAHLAVRSSRRAGVNEVQVARALSAPRSPADYAGQRPCSAVRARCSWSPSPRRWIPSPAPGWWSVR